MTGLYIFAAVVCVLLILLHSRVRVTVKHNTDSGDEPEIYVSYMFLKFGISPKKKKRVNLRDYSYKRFQKSEKKRLKKESRKAEKAKAKAAKKEADKKAREAARQAAKAAKKEAPSQTSGTASSPKEEPKKKGIVSVIWEIKHLIFDALKRFPTKLRLDVSRLKLRIGGKDAATTAITYGAVTEAVGALLVVLESFMKVKRGHENEIEIVPDFTSGKIDADVLIRVSISPAGVLSIVFGFIKGYIVHLLKKL